MLRGKLNCQKRLIVIRFGESKDSIFEIKDMITQDRKTIDELKLGMVRLRKHDEFFADCNRKLYNMDLQ